MLTHNSLTRQPYRRFLPPSMPHAHYQDGTSYSVGAVATGFAAQMSGLSLADTLPLAAILPAIVMLVINIPKFLREAVLLYREYKIYRENKNADSTTNRRED